MATVFINDSSIKYHSPIKYQWVSDLTPANVLPFDTVTFPSIAKHWQVFQQRGALHGIAAFQEQQLVGLVLVEILPEMNGMEILSLFVCPTHRQQGIGTRLIHQLQTLATKLNCPHIQVKYQATELAKIALEAIFAKLNWSTPETEFLLAESTTTLIQQAPWMHRYPLPAAFTTFPWIDLTPAEIEHLQHRQDYPKSLSPFSDDSRLEPLTSLGLRYQDHNHDRVVGWVITHRIAPDTIRYSTMYVEPPFQRLGRGVSLFVEAIKRQIDSPIPRGKYAVAKENVLMISFVQRHAKPYLTFLSESRQAQIHTANQQPLNIY
jgi:GNAT superfamily N-acetyltransferase